MLLREEERKVQTVDKKETSFLSKLAVLAVVAFAAVTLVQLQMKYNEYKYEREQLRAEVDDYQDLYDELLEKAESEADRDYVVEVAKEKLNLRLPEEVIFYNDLFN